jgi:Protein of unknown function (DUF1812).
MLLWVLPGCIKENLDDCVQLPGIRAVAVAPSGYEPVNSQDIGVVVFYVFDQDEKWLDTFSAALHETVLLDYPQAERLWVVGLANANNGNPVADGVLTLQYLRDYLSTPVYEAPSDAFWGEVNFLNKRRAGAIISLPLMRVVSSVSVKIRGLKEYRQVDDEDFSLVLSAGYQGVGFHGQPVEGLAGYLPAGDFVSQTPSQYNVPAFRIISSAQGSPVVLKIYHKNVLIDSISVDSSGRPLMAYNGKLLEIQISYTASLFIVVQMHSEWDQENYWKEF